MLKIEAAELVGAMMSTKKKENSPRWIERRWLLYHVRCDESA